jgi:hypothetical protein
MPYWWTCANQNNHTLLASQITLSVQNRQGKYLIHQENDPWPQIVNQTPSRIEDKRNWFP